MYKELHKLIHQCKKNNRDAQAVLYELYKNTLFSLSLKYCRNYADAEDNLQDSFISIFTKITTYNSNYSFEAWMKRITINKAIDKYRKTKYKREELLNNNIVTSFFSDEENIMISELPLDIILEMVQNLPDKYRLVFNLYELDDYSHKEIADLLNISEGTSKSNLHRARKILKENLVKMKNK